MKKIIITVGVITLGIGFLLFSLSGCGGTLGNALSKVATEAGQCAVNFDGDNTDGHHNYVSAGANYPSLRTPGGSARDYTVEAWIKTTVGGPVYSRGQDIVGEQLLTGGGIALYVHQGAAKFIVDGTVAPFPNPSTQVASSFTAVDDGEWHHIAGVLVQAAHDHNIAPPGFPPAGTTSLTNPNTLVAGTCDAAMPGLHIDVYVDGRWEECSPVAAIPAVVYDNLCEITDVNDHDYLKDIPCVHNIGRDLPSFTGGLLAGGLFTGVIDEVRVWMEARSEDQIDFWMNAEIRGEDEWRSADPNNMNAGYWSFNQCTGHEATDSSGYGNVGSGNLCLGLCNTSTELSETWIIDWVPGHETLY